MNHFPARAWPLCFTFALVASGCTENDPPTGADPGSGGPGGATATTSSSASSSGSGAGGGSSTSSGSGAGGAASIDDPGLEGPAFSLDDATCTESASAIFCKDVVYSVVDGVELHLDLYAPPVAKAQKVPAIMYLHGGGWAFGSWHNPGLDLEGYLAEGRAVVSIEYRLILGPDKVTPTGIGFPDNLQDVKTAIRWMRMKGAGFIDGSRIVAYGFSAGAHLAAMVAATAGNPDFEGRGDPSVPTAVSGAVTLSAPFDFQVFVPDNPAFDPACPAQELPKPDPRYAISLLVHAGGTPENSGELLDDPKWDGPIADLSPITHVGPSTAPMLTFNGTCDITVPVKTAQDFEDYVEKQGLDQIQNVVVEGAKHGGTLQPPESKAALDQFLSDLLDAP